MDASPPPLSSSNESSIALSKHVFSASPYSVEVYQPLFTFLPNVCNYCKASRTAKLQLMKCSRCKVVSYCSAEHQKLDFPKHRSLCAALKSVSDKGNKFFVGEVRNEKDWKAYRSGKIDLIEKELKRKCLPHESSLLLNEECCQVCYRPSQPLRPCALCHTVVFCSSHSQETPLPSSLKKKSNHKDICEIYQWELQCEKEIAQYFQSFLVEQERQQIKQPKITVLDDPENPPPLPPGNGYFLWRSTVPAQPAPLATVQMELEWESHLNKFGLPGIDLFQLFAITDILTNPLTVAYCIKQMLPPAVLLSQDTFVIHILGATAWEDASHPLRYEEILHLFPMIKTLEIVLIGPEVPAFFDDEDTGHPRARIIRTSSLCQQCSAKTLRVARCQDLYHRYMAPYIDSLESKAPLPVSDAFIPPKMPTMVFAFNSGIQNIGGKSEPSKMLAAGAIKERSQFEEVEKGAEEDVWGPTIDLLIQYSIPAVFTAQNEEECKLNAIRLAIQGAQMSLDPKANPFRSMRPKRDIAHQGKFLYSNHWLLAIEGPLS